MPRHRLIKDRSAMPNSFYPLPRLAIPAKHLWKKKGKGGGDTVGQGPRRLNNQKGGKRIRLTKR